MALNRDGTLDDEGMARARAVGEMQRQQVKVLAELLSRGVPPLALAAQAGSGYAWMVHAAAGLLASRARSAGRLRRMRSRARVAGAVAPPG